MQKDPKTIVRAYFDRLLNQKDLSVCDELLAPNYIDHDAVPNTPPGPKATQKWVANFLDQYPNLQVQIKKITSQGQCVTAELTWTGTHKDTAEPYKKTATVTVQLNNHGQIIKRQTT